MRKEYSEAELRERNDFLESLINYCPGVLYIYDLIDKKNIFISKGIEKVLGYSAQEVKDFGSQLIPSLMHTDDSAVYYNTLLPKYEFLQDGESLRFEYRMKHKMGHWRSLAS
jgi:PAS domain-containing protein